jgi:hypothetical protein
MQRLGISEDVIDAVQAHAKAGIKRVYQRHKYAAEKRGALEAWGEWIQAHGENSAVREDRTVL